MGRLAESLQQMYQGPKLHITEFVDIHSSKEFIRQAIREAGDQSSALARSAGEQPAAEAAAAAVGGVERAVEAAVPPVATEWVTDVAQNMAESTADMVEEVTRALKGGMGNHNAAIRNALVYGHPMSPTLKPAPLA